MNVQTGAHLTSRLQELPMELRPVAERNWHQVAERVDVSAVQRLGESDLDTLIRVLACSDYLSAVIGREWDWLCGWLNSGGSDRPSSYDEDIDTASRGDEFDEAAVKKQLREHRHRQLLRIMWLEYAGHATLDHTLRSLSSLADNLIVAATRYAHALVSEKFGHVLDDNRQPVRLVVLAMGKLGGCELNFSSDVDLVLLYPGGGTSDGKRPLQAQEYFTRVARRLITLLDDVTENGFVYRVDTRLRPFGDSGPLVASLPSLESYLLQHGRGWERYAYVKARIIGDAVSTSLRQDIEEMIGPFVYRRYLDYGVFESLRDMKELITAEVRKRELSRNIKLGFGGIREIEFIVQSLQLVRGGRNHRLRQTQLRPVLRELTRSKDMDMETADDLDAAYVFLRRLENFMQAIHDQQTHDCPDAGPELDRLALAMRCDADDLVRELQRHRVSVAAHFENVVFRSAGQAEPAGDELSAAWNRAAKTEEWRDILIRRDFKSPEELADSLQRFRSLRQVDQLDSVAHRRLAAFVGPLLDEIRSFDAPAVVFDRVAIVLEKVLRRSAYIAMLNENRPLTARLVDLCAQSAYFAEEIARYPLLLDELLDPRLFTSVHSAADMRAEIDERMRQVDERDVEGRVQALGQFQRASLFRIAIAEFGGNLPIMKVSDALTELAEQVLEEALRLAWRDLTQKHGVPQFRDAGQTRPAGFAVVAYGKLGGIELSYGSDLDLVFLHDSRGTAQHTNGTSSIENTVFFSRLVRRLVHFLTTQTATGALYEVDTRLRPSGRSGLLVTSIEAFERYQQENAWTWEHQALLRSRPVAGHNAVSRDFLRIRRQILCTKPDPVKLAGDVRQMRDRMRKQLDRSNPSMLDLKQGEGGIADIEFLVQFLALKSASQHPEVVHFPDNIRQLGVLGAVGVLPESEVATLQAVYRDFRSFSHRAALDSAPGLVARSEVAEKTKLVKSIWARELGASAGDP